MFFFVPFLVFFVANKIDSHKKHNRTPKENRKVFGKESEK